MNGLKQKIIEKIQRTGPISFKNFMEMALYEPDLGYYTSQKTKIGRAGDFYTSSHLHPVYGVMIGRQIEEMWEIMKRPSDFYIIEMGAGVGYLCKDMLDYLKSRKMFDSLNYIIVEINPVMRERQKDLLSDYLNKVSWSLSLKEFKNIKSCILSNELLDSFPVHLIEMEDGIREVFIDVKGEELTEIREKPGDEIVDYLKEFYIEITKGYRTEINLNIKKWLREINDVLKEGFIFTIDYGYPARDYYSEDRNRGTLLCYYKHQVIEDPYQNIGEQDITAHVNFSSVKKWGEEEGFKTIGFCPQGTFLISLGIDEMIQEIYKDSHDYLFEVAKIKRLIFPGTMGETHKVMIQYKGDGYPELRGFSLKNQKKKL
ncbi:MAG: SAM-dependent methyltransferase [Nitrospirota bacterium]|nr:SAM-dependent methyltransferase [Nitrospirota bacterium]MDH5768333.1 SAM-dependent methyltransferase [Nitrospirota bacterium]